VSVLIREAPWQCVEKGGVRGPNRPTGADAFATSAGDVGTEAEVSRGADLRGMPRANPNAIRRLDGRESARESPGGAPCDTET